MKLILVARNEGLGESDSRGGVSLTSRKINRAEAACDPPKGGIGDNGGGSRRTATKKKENNSVNSEFYARVHAASRSAGGEPADPGIRSRRRTREIVPRGWREKRIDLRGREWTHQKHKAHGRQRVLGEVVAERPHLGRGGEGGCDGDFNGDPGRARRASVGRTAPRATRCLSLLRPVGGKGGGGSRAPGLSQRWRAARRPDARRLGSERRTTRGETVHQLSASDSVRDTLEYTLIRCSRADGGLSAGSGNQVRMASSDEGRKKFERRLAGGR